MINIENLKPFPKFCCSIGMIPTSYKISLTYEEQLLWLCDFLENTVIPTVNNNGQAVEELQNLFVTLTNYINNYFDNLDVQEEINNKLDEMVEDGTLPEIIASYLNSKAIFGFDNVDSMKNATNLINGSYAETLGFYNKNDGGKALYKIRTITNNDVVDEMTIIALYDNTLIAELITDNELNIKQLGGKGDNLTDNLIIFNKAISYCNNNKLALYIPSGTYIISDSLTIPSHMTIKGENQENTILTFNSNGLTFNNVNFCNISNIFIKGIENTNYGLYFHGLSVHNVNFENVLVYDFNKGIYSDATSVWCCSYRNMRIGTCLEGLDLYQGFNLTFINFYIDRCKHVMNLQRTKATSFIGCNFSIVNDSSNEHVLNFGTNVNICFESCNFECDEKYTHNHIFQLSSRMIKFNNCNFLLNCASSVHVFLLYNTFKSLIFENCSYMTKTGNEMDDANFWNKAYFNSSKIGGIKFLTADDIPRPSSLYSQQYQYYEDVGNGVPINFYGTSINKDLLTKGTLLFQRDTNTLCLFDGTNVVKVSDGTIII